jgi:dual specificity MAP kinase phosphatase
MSFYTEIRRLFLLFKYQGMWKGTLAAYDKIVRFLTGGLLTRFCRVTDELWIGGQQSGAGLRTLRTHGITTVVNMRSEYDYPELANLYELKYLRLPTDDRGAPSIADIRKGVEFVTREIKGWGRVFIHCWEGIGRSATMAAAYFVSAGSAPVDAWKKISKVRPFIRPNKAQIEQLDGYSRIKI